MARPRKTEGEKREDRINPRLTPAERAEIEEHARVFGVSPSEFMRRRTLGYRLPHTLAEQRQNAVIRAEFAWAANNLNQIARHFNAGGDCSAEVEAELLTLIARMNAELDRLYGPGSNGGGPQL